MFVSSVEIRIVFSILGFLLLFVWIVEVDGEEFKIPNSCFTLETTHEKVSGERIIPNVLEPSFGIDRIFYTLLEHSFKELEAPAELMESEADREGNKDETYRILSFPSKFLRHVCRDNISSPKSIATNKRYSQCLGPAGWQ